MKRNVLFFRVIIWLWGKLRTFNSKKLVVILYSGGQINSSPSIVIIIGLYSYSGWDFSR